MARQVRAAVAASGEWLDPDDNVRLPAGDVHAWLPGTNQTLCGLALSRSRLMRFAHVPFAQVLPESGPGVVGKGATRAPEPFSPIVGLPPLSVSPALWG